MKNKFSNMIWQMMRNTLCMPQLYRNTQSVHFEKMLFQALLVKNSVFQGPFGTFYQKARFCGAYFSKTTKYYFSFFSLIVPLIRVVYPLGEFNQQHNHITPVNEIYTIFTPIMPFLTPTFLFPLIYISIYIQKLAPIFLWVLKVDVKLGVG